MRDDVAAEVAALLRERGGVLLYGPVGIGKSAVADAVAAAEEGRVLRCAPAAPESGLPFLGLIDLFAELPDGVLAALPAGLRGALRSALLRGSLPGRDLDRLALRLAAAEVCRALAADGPLLLVLDGVQWLDRPSAEVLEFLARRAGELGLRVLATERTAEGETPGCHGLCPPGAPELAVAPLTPAELTELLAPERLRADELRQIQRLAAGNPLYALELARARHDGALEVPRRLRARLLGPGLPPGLRPALVLAAAASAPTLSLLRAAGGGDPLALLARAYPLLDVGADGAVVFRHPILRAAVLAEAAPGERLRAHRALAAIIGDPVEQARQLALASPGEDAAVARSLTEAAAVARRRRDPQAGYELSALAAARTPAGQPGERWERLLAAGADACAAGLREEARQAALAVLTESDPLTGRRRPVQPDLRVRARLVLLRAAGQALDAAGGLIADGLVEAVAEPALQAPLRYWAAVRALLGGRLGEAADQAGRAAGLSERAGDAGTRIAALGVLAEAQALGGQSGEAALDLGLALPGGGEERRGLLRRRALLALDADRPAEARHWLAGLLEPGETGFEDVLATLVALSRVQVRAGECDAAIATTARCARLLEERGVESAPVSWAAALAELAGGTAARAVAHAQTAVALATRDGDQLHRVRALDALGRARLAAPDALGAAAAVEALQLARALGAELGLADPDAVRRLAALAEGLVVLGEQEEAVSVLAVGRRLPVRSGGAAAALDRAEGLLLAARGRTAEAVELLSAAAERLRALGLPLEQASTLIALGSVERRARRRAAGRTALAAARQLCLAYGAAPLLLRIEQEVERLGSGGREERLTASEQRVAVLVSEGATNREVAAALFVSVKTVEGTLSRVYRKLGVRSRTSLARAMVTAVPTADISGSYNKQGHPRF